MKPASSLTLVALTASAAVLTACGGDNAEHTADAPMRAGDEYTALIWMDDQPVQAETRKVFGVAADGTLIDQPDAQHLEGALVSLTTSVDASAPPSADVHDMAALQAFLHELWAALQARHGTQDPHAVWREVGDQDQPLAAVYADYLRSGLSLPDWVDFYATIDEFDLPSAAPGLQEREVARWLQTAEASHADLLRALASMGQDWRGLLATLQTRGDGFDALRQRWVLASPQDLGAFLRTYLAAPASAALRGEQLQALPDTWEYRRDLTFWLRNPNVGEHWQASREWHTAMTDRVYQTETYDPRRTDYRFAARRVSFELCKEKRSKIGEWIYGGPCKKTLSYSSFDLNVRFARDWAKEAVDLLVVKQTAHYDSWGEAQTWVSLDRADGPIGPNYQPYAVMQVTVGVTGFTDTGVRHDAQRTFKIDALKSSLN